MTIYGKCEWCGRPHLQSCDCNHSPLPREIATGVGYGDAVRPTRPRSAENDMRKVLICGSRDWTDVRAVIARVSELPPDSVVITGKADGADSQARHAALARGLWVIDVPVERQHWEHYGKSAGHKRNHVMIALEPCLVIAFQRDDSSGTQGTIDDARRHDIPVEVHSA